LNVDFIKENKSEKRLNYEFNRKINNKIYELPLEVQKQYTLKKKKLEIEKLRNQYHEISISKKLAPEAQLV
jgi:hypothetical protein